MNKKTIMIFSSYVLVLILLCGCTTTSGGRFYGRGSSAGESLDVASILRFDDVPVPSGFKILGTESFAFQNDVTRVALLKYLGSKNEELTVSFYKDQMPLYNWSPINIIEYERRILNYENASESCIVTIESRGKKSVVIIAISPKSRPMKVEK